MDNSDFATEKVPALYFRSIRSAAASKNETLFPLRFTLLVICFVDSQVGKVYNGRSLSGNGKTIN